MALIEFLKMGAASTVDMIWHAGGTVKDLLFPPRYDRDSGRPWWRKPGLGIMYQIEYRPGTDWGRDYDEYNRSMTGPDGRLAFDGPFCRPEEWVELSTRACADYHQMEIKWHDGICYFDTALTDWKTPEDYTARFASASRAAGIPFMFYYSCIFDHNPDFDSIQPSPDKTMSFIGYDRRYVAYLESQYREIMEQYEPDGMWLDWYWADAATDASIEFFRREYPGTVIAFNVSNFYPSAHRRLDYTSGEAHSLDGPYLRLRKLGDDFVPVFTSAWKWATLARRLFAPCWELIAPVGRWWQDPSLREDPDDLLRMTAVILASGGLFVVGATSRMDGSIYEDQVKQLEILGDWYGPRKHLFTGSVPARYRRREPPGVEVSPASFRTVACENDKGMLLHLVNMEGSTKPVTVELSGRMWKGFRSASLEPQGTRLEMHREPSLSSIKIPADLCDRVDTIVRLER
jgi:alpha-L-fucosidase